MMQLAQCPVSKSHPTGVRGLKFGRDFALRVSSESHPTGVRGLKSIVACCGMAWFMSHPTGVRGLKSQPQELAVSGALVAPHWGAWIEIGLQHRYCNH